MKIFSNFDTTLKRRTFARYQKQFGHGNVVLIVKWRLFWIEKIFMPLVFYVVMSSGILYLFYYFLWYDGFLYGGIPLVSLGLFILAGPLLTRYIEYKMDFSVVTPKLLITYDQKWIFRRNIKTINTLNIKTVSVEKVWFWYSLFNTWDLVFLSEWWDMQHGEVVLHYISKPEKHRHAIAFVLGRV